MTYSGLPHAQTLSLKQACAYVQLNCHQGLASHSTSVNARRKRAVLAISRSRSSVDSFSIWSASSEAPTTAGATWGKQYIMKVHIMASGTSQQPQRKAVPVTKRAGKQWRSKLRGAGVKSQQCRRQAGAGGRAHRVAEQVRARALPQDVYHCAAGRRVPACSPANPLTTKPFCATGHACPLHG